MADRPEDHMQGPAMHETKPHPNAGRPSTSTGDATDATDARSGLGSDAPQKSGALRMVMYAVLAVVVVLVVVGLFA